MPAIHLKGLSRFVVAILVLATTQALASTENPTQPDDTKKQIPATNASDETSPTIPDEALPVVDELPNDEDATDDAEREPPLPPVLKSLDLVPKAVRDTHQKLTQAAKQADWETLRGLMGTGEMATSLSIGGLVGDPIDFLKVTSGDVEGYEILAILLEVLEAGFVHVDVGTENEMYIWPYFFAWPLEKLTPVMKVEMFRILTAGDVQDSTEFGGYIFYRVGIRPDGRWDFFVAGD